MVVYVCGTGCQIFVENDHKLGCAASVEHTPHSLGRPSSYKHALEHLETARSEKKWETVFFCYGNA